METRARLKIFCKLLPLFAFAVAVAAAPAHQSPVRSAPAVSPAPAMWQTQRDVNNQDWKVCAGTAAKALASLGYAVAADKDGQGRQRIFYGTGDGRNSAMINCSWSGTTALTVITGSSASGTSDAQVVVNRLTAYMASPAQGNLPAVSNQLPASASPGLAQRQQNVSNQPWSACTGKAQQALASLGYRITNVIDGHGFESNFYGTGDGPNSAAIGCATVGTLTVYTITGSSTRGNIDARSVANRLYNFIFPPAPAK